MSLIRLGRQNYISTRKNIRFKNTLSDLIRKILKYQGFDEHLKALPFSKAKIKPLALVCISESSTSIKETGPLSNSVVNEGFIFDATTGQD